MKRNCIKVAVAIMYLMILSNSIMASCPPGFSQDGVTGKCLLPGYTTGGGGLGGLTPFQDAFTYVLPLPTDTPAGASVPHYTISFNQFTQKVHLELAPTLFWGYGDGTPGGNPVTIGKAIVQPIGQPFNVTFINNLPMGDMNHIFAPFLPEVPGTTDFMPSARGVVHLHGLPNIEVSDGLPLQWIDPGQKVDLFFPNPTDRTVFSFYHDHAMMITRLNVYAGLAGGWIMVDPNDAAYNLPAGLDVYDIPMVLQDRSFYTDGSLNYNMPGFNYDYPMVNGTVSPFLNVQPRKYLFRLLNGNQSSFFGIGFSNDPTLADLSNVPFQIIGSDGGFLDATVNMTAGKFLPIAPGEKYWVVVDFKGHEGENIIMTNQDPTGIFPGIAAYQNTMGSYFSGFSGPFTVNNRIMQFRVSTTPVTDTSTVPETFPPLTPSAEQLIQQATYVRNIVIEGSATGGFPAFDAPNIPGDNNTPLMIMPINYSRFADPVTEMPLLGSTEIWNFINPGSEIHPFHTHLVFYRILDRRPFDESKYIADRLTGNLQPLESYVIGPVQPAQPWEQGLKETAQCPQGYITRVAIIWGPYAQNYMYHCHILDHEEFEMMRPISVIPSSTYFYELTRKYDGGPLLPAS